MYIPILKIASPQLVSLNTYTNKFQPTTESINSFASFPTLTGLQDRKLVCTAYNFFALAWAKDKSSRCGLGEVTKAQFSFLLSEAELHHANSEISGWVLKIFKFGRL